jgi:hypothetical protein
VDATHRQMQRLSCVESLHVPLVPVCNLQMLLTTYYIVQELVNICWACAKLGYHPGPLLQDFTRQIGKLVRHITSWSTILARI